MICVMLTLKMLRWQAAGKMTETEIVRKDPMSDMTYARNGTNRAAAKHPVAIAVRTANRRRPTGTPAEISSRRQF